MDKLAFYKDLEAVLEKHGIVEGKFCDECGGAV